MLGQQRPPNKFQVAYDAFVVVGQVREWSFEMTRAEIDVTTIGQGNQQYVPFRTFIAGFGEGSGSATFYFTNEDANMGNRIIEGRSTAPTNRCSFQAVYRPCVYGRCC